MHCMQQNLDHPNRAPWAIATHQLSTPRKHASKYTQYTQGLPRHTCPSQPYSALPSDLWLRKCACTPSTPRNASRLHRAMIHDAFNVVISLQLRMIARASHAALRWVGVEVGVGG